MEVDFEEAKRKCAPLHTSSEVDDFSGQDPNCPPHLFAAAQLGSTDWVVAALSSLRERGCGDLSAVTDTHGVSPLHWAALNGHCALIHVLVRHGCSVWARDHRTGQAPIHWAAVKGNASALHAILSAQGQLQLERGRGTGGVCGGEGEIQRLGHLGNAGANGDNNGTADGTGGAGARGTTAGDVSGGTRLINAATGPTGALGVGADVPGGEDSMRLIDARDAQGCTPIIVAAQNQRFAALLYLAGVGASLEARDGEGHTPLMWCAYVGHAPSCARLCQDAAVDATDADGATALHWAGTKGRISAAAVLLRAGADPSVRDKAGNTAADLASRGGHENVAGLIGDAASHAQPREIGGDAMVRLGVPGAPVPGALGRDPRTRPASRLQLYYFFIVGHLSAILWGYVVPQFYPVISGPVAVVAVVFGLLHALFYAHTAYTDPGYVDPSVQDMIEQVEQGVFESPCETCFVQRPMRGKHCRDCNRCVARMDHHCPWTNNCVGALNHWSFFGFVAATSVYSCAATYLYAQGLFLDPSRPPLEEFGAFLLHVTFHNGLCLYGLIFVFIVALLLTILAVSQAAQITRGLTTNETFNHGRYGYLHGTERHGVTHNPFSDGALENWKTFVREAYDRDTVDWRHIHTVENYVEALGRARARRAGGWHALASV